MSDEPTTLPTIREVERWDREHRQECVELHCTLAHRMLAFADWYIVIADEFEKRIRADERSIAEARDATGLAGLREALDAHEWNGGGCVCGWIDPEPLHRLLTFEDEAHEAWADHREQAVRAALAAAPPEPRWPSRDLLESLVDDEECRFDHHGGCQAHGYLDLQHGDECPQHELKRGLAALREGGERP